MTLQTGQPQGDCPYKTLYMDTLRKSCLEEKERLGFQNLRPIQFAVANRREIMLPFQLGKINSEGEQSVIVYFLSDRGRTEAKNYTNVMIPSNFNVPADIESEFGQFYQDLLETTIEATGRETVVTEYAWDTGWCDPCSSKPLDGSELRQLGMNRDTAFITRLYFQYDRDTYNRDLVFRLTNDRRTYQGRYILTPDLTQTPEPAFAAEVRAPYGKLYII